MFVDQVACITAAKGEVLWCLCVGVTWCVTGQHAELAGHVVCLGVAGRRQREQAECSGCSGGVVDVALACWMPGSCMLGDLCGNNSGTGGRSRSRCLDPPAPSHPALSHLSPATPASRSQGTPTKYLFLGDSVFVCVFYFCFYLLPLKSDEWIKFPRWCDTHDLFNFIISFHCLNSQITIYIFKEFGML